uniref:Adenylate kinase n=1 Tax=Candidatus Methanophagaceae archaeon ANME-1 ERB6 TaxID=2759912 RepID=A0A7G9YTC5_9EURY|nr:adenylate kinase [Methanosarcinales archaeon ANME-1 ERB6]
MQPKFIVLLGAPGASKGTQAEGISETLSIPQVASGDLFREALEKGTELGVLAKSYIEKGELVLDKVTIARVQKRVPASDCEMGAILDGFPRTSEQAKKRASVISTVANEEVQADMLNAIEASC